MVQSFQNKRALLIGNGINRIDSSQSFSWDDLLKELKDNHHIEVDLDNIFKPFPLAFDEMLHRKSGSDNFKDKVKKLKQQLRHSIDRHLENKRGFNEYHGKFIALDYDNILTTNYDYSLEKSVCSNFSGKKKELAINKHETRHSLKRRYELPGIQPKIWHIHGELLTSRSATEKEYAEESIMIGYEHYASYLNLIQQKTIGKSGTRTVEDQSLMVRLKNEVASPFWIDIFFTHNLDIIGQGLDFSENHLWWLINYRANAMRQTKTKHGVKINNIIRFFYPQIDGENRVDISEFNDFNKIIKKKNNFNKSKAIAEVLKAFEVIPHPINCKSYQVFYDQVISQLLQ